MPASPVSPPVFDHDIGDIVTFKHHMAMEGDLTTGYIFKVLSEPGQDVVYYYYCDVDRVGVYGTLSSLHKARPAAPHILQRIERWWEIQGFPASPPPRPTPERHFQAGEFIAVRNIIPAKPIDTFEFVTGYIYRVVIRSNTDIATYWYCNVHKPGVYGQATTHDVVAPPHMVSSFGLERWWDEAEFHTQFLAQQASFSPEPPASPKPAKPSVLSHEPSPPCSPRPAYSPIDWETDPIYLAAKAKKLPAFVNFEPCPPDAKTIKKSKTEPKKTKTEYFDEYHGWSPDGGCSHLRWGSPAPPPRAAKRGKRKAKQSKAGSPSMPELALPQAVITVTAPACKKARATTVEELLCHEDMAECVSCP
jgi:hypothetical protein